MPDARGGIASASATSRQQHQWGGITWCPPPSPTPPTRETVVVFLDFLENRMATKNIPLLRRMVADFYAGHDQTLQEFAELSVNLVAMLPFEVREPSKRAIAARILQQQQQRQCLAHANQSAASGGHSESPCVFMYFQARVGTKNLPWLKRIYCEFCEGREDALIDFLRIGVEAISILPVLLPASDYQRWMVYKPRQMPPFADSQMQVTTGVHTKGNYRRNAGGVAVPDQRPSTPRTPKKRALPQDPGTLTVAALLPPPPPLTKLPKRSHHDKPNGDAAHSMDGDQLALIRAEYMRIEATEPWTQVFHDYLKSPLDMRKHPDLGLTLKRFLVEHGRAIWERTFWVPLSKSKDRERLLERRKRQESAKKVFVRRVIKPVHKSFGAQFFVDLDENELYHEGWWYRQPAVDLGTLWRMKGGRFCLDYLRGQYLERFPDTQCPELRAKTRGHHVWSESMWSSDNAARYVLADIRRLKCTMDEDLGNGSDADNDDDGDDNNNDGDNDDDDEEDIE